MGCDNPSRSRAHIETHKKLMTDPKKQILLPVIFHMDGTNTGQFVDLPLTAVKFSLGIFTRKAPDEDHFWRTLGCVPAHSEHESNGERIMHQSQHVDSTTNDDTDALDEANIVDDNVPEAQDLHAISQVIFENCVESQKTGFEWDLFCNNRRCKDMEFVLFAPFFKVDSDEAEKLCGEFTSRTSNVKQLCRHCHVPTSESDKPFERFPLKKKREIQASIAANDEETLRSMSQHCIENATHRLRFGMHNKQSIHGACPLDMLHALPLGIFRCVRDCFFTQLGPTSNLSVAFDSLAQKCGALLSRQSCRDLPKTRFTGGMRRGKLNAKGTSLAFHCAWQLR